MFEVRYKGTTICGNNIFTVYAVSDDYFLIYMGDTWKWVSMGYTEPYIKGMGI
jgi:hypothetical protein